MNFNKKKYAQGTLHPIDKYVFILSEAITS